MLANSNHFIKYIISHIIHRENMSSLNYAHTHCSTNYVCLIDLARARPTYIQVYRTMQYTGWPKTWHTSLPKKENVTFW